MAQFDLRQTLADIAPGLPAGFDPGAGIRSLFPPGQASSISLLANYHFLYTDSLHAVGVTCPFTIDIWGSGKYKFSGTASNGDIIDANYAIGYAFEFAPGGTAHGDVYNGKAGAENSDYFDHSGSDEWIVNNWPQAFASGVNVDLKVSENPLTLVVSVVGTIVIVGAWIFLLLGGTGEFKKQPDGSYRYEF